MWMLSSPKDGLQWVPWTSSPGTHPGSLVMGQPILLTSERQKLHFPSCIATNTCQSDALRPDLNWKLGEVEGEAGVKHLFGMWILADAAASNLLGQLPSAFPVAAEASLLFLCHLWPQWQSSHSQQKLQI